MGEVSFTVLGDLCLVVGVKSGVNFSEKKSTKIVNETSPIHLDSHYKVVELAEIYRLVCRKWGGR